MHLSQVDKQEALDAAKVVADASRLDVQSVQKGAESMRSVFPTAQQAADNLMRNLEALRGMGF